MLHGGYLPHTNMPAARKRCPTGCVKKSVGTATRSKTGKPLTQYQKFFKNETAKLKKQFGFKVGAGEKNTVTWRDISTMVATEWGHMSQARKDAYR
jgi:hypothetical protein